MLFFIDETWQTVAGQPVGALGAVGIPRARYNGFCREIWQIKRNVLGANELSDGEIKGTNSFAKAAFHKRERAGFSRLLPSGSEGQLLFDNRGTSEDLSAACAIQNFIVRVSPDWRRRFMQTPHFTLSAVSPGLQAADLIAYLAAHRHNPSHRPELADYWTRVERIAFATKRSGPALRAVDAIPEKPRNGKKKGPGETKPPKRR